MQYSRRFHNLRPVTKRSAINSRAAVLGWIFASALLLALCGTKSIAAQPAGTLFFDDFTRATDPGPLSPWVVAQGPWTVTGGVLQAANSGSYSDAYVPGNWSNITVQGSVRFPTSGWAAGLSARLNPATGTRYVANIFPENTPETGFGLHLRLMKFLDWTSYNTLVEVPLPGGNLGTNWHTVTMTLRANEIIVYLDGTQVTDFLDNSAPYTSGSI